MKNYNITLIGDSIAKGIATENMRLTRLDTCASILVGEYLGANINNLSVYGQTIGRVEEKKLVEKYIENLDKSKNNKVVFSIGGNDADFDWVEVGKNPSFNHQPKTSHKIFETTLRKMIRMLKNEGVDVWITGLPPVDSYRYFDRVICKIANGENVLDFLDEDISNIQRHQEFYNFLLYKIAVTENCGFLDIRSIFLKDKNFLEKFCSDGVHPNKEGHKMIADEIIKQIELHRQNKRL